MTEDEAKTKICCGPWQARSPTLLAIRCQGSACMAFRWSRDVTVVLSVPDNNKGRHGFCGLACRP